MQFAVPLVLITAAWVLLVLQVDPVPTWFYVFVWYPTLVLLDNLASRMGRKPRLLRDGRLIVSLFGWSAVIWLVFEAVNFRLQNWYYVFLPRAGPERWAGILLSFATVVPAIVLMERLLRARGVAASWRTPPLSASRFDVHVALGLGGASAALALGWPRIFFTLVWGAAWLLADAIVYRLDPPSSLMRDLTRGDWGRAGRLMLGGLLVGLLWETYNYWARGKWIYTVPWLETTKLFEMPPFGFLGFPFFALEAWSMYHALCALRVAVPLAMGGRREAASGKRKAAPKRETGTGKEHGGLQTRRVGIAVLVAAVFVVATLWGMERLTISSTVPRLADLPGITGEQATTLRERGIRTPFALAARDETWLAMPGENPEDWRPAIESARITVLRGIGHRHAGTLAALGIDSVCGLARSDPAVLWTQVRSLQPIPTRRPTPAEVRVWVRAASRRCTSYPP